MRFNDLRITNDLSHPFSHVYNSFIRPELMQCGIECPYRSKHGFEVHCCNNIRMIQAVLHFFGKKDSMGCNKLGAVDEGKSFLWPHFKGLKAILIKHFTCCY